MRNRVWELFPKSLLAMWLVLVLIPALFPRSALATEPTISIVQHSLSGDSVCLYSLTCTVTLNLPTGAGHALMLGIAGASTTAFPTVASISGDSTWSHASSCYGTLNQPDYTLTDCWYILSAAGGATSITVTFTGPAGPGDINNMDVDVMELSCSSACNFSYDTSNSLIASAFCTICASETLSLSGANDVIMQV